MLEITQTLSPTMANAKAHAASPAFALHPHELDRESEATDGGDAFETGAVAEAQRVIPRRESQTLGDILQRRLSGAGGGQVAAGPTPLRVTESTEL